MIEQQYARMKIWLPITLRVQGIERVEAQWISVSENLKSSKFTLKTPDGEITFSEPTSLLRRMLTMMSQEEKDKVLDPTKMKEEFKTVRLRPWTMMEG
jgi:hypothetical protein